jgi:hypothetical protein
MERTIHASAIVVNAIIENEIVCGAIVENVTKMP